jgi:PAS domain S-box-containing protein
MVASTRDAIVSLLQVPYTALITDVSLPAFDLVLKVCRLLQPETPCLVISGETMTDRRVLAMRLGADVVLQKPVDREVFCAWIEAAVQSGRERVAPSSATELYYLKAMVNAVNALLFMTDPQWLILVFNRAAEIMTGYTAREVYGRNLLELLIPAEWRAAVADPFKGSVRMPQRNPWLTKSGQTELIEWRYSTLEMSEYARPCIVGLGIPVEREDA